MPYIAESLRRPWWVVGGCVAGTKVVPEKEVKKEKSKERERASGR